MSRADCADLAVAAPRSWTSFTTLRKPFIPCWVSVDVRPLNNRSRAVGGACGGASASRRSCDFLLRPPRGSLFRISTRRGPRQFVGGRVYAVAPRRRRRRAHIPARLRSRLARRLGLHLADRLFERQPLLGDLRFRQRRFDRAQLRDQCGARPLVKPPASFTGALLKPFYRTDDERMIVGHRLSLRSAPAFFILIHVSNGFCIRIVSSRSGLVDNMAAEQPISSSSRRTYLIACAGRSAHERACAVFSPQPAMVS